VWINGGIKMKKIPKAKITADVSKEGISNIKAIKKSKAKIVSIYWTNKGNTIFDGTNIIKEVEDKDVLIVTTNMPEKFLKIYLDNGNKVLRCNPYDFKVWSEDKIIVSDEDEEADKVNAKERARLILQFYKEKQDEFQNFELSPPLLSYYELFKELQKVRVAMGNRLYDKETDDAKIMFGGLERLEKDNLKVIEKNLKEYAIYTEFLCHIKGLGVALDGGLISIIKDIKRFPNVAKLWSYFGYNVVKDEKTGDWISQKKRKGQTCNWSQRGRALCYIISDMFIKHRTPCYRDIYDKEKERQLALHPDMSKGHADNRARRKTVKIFLQHVWVKWRELEGLPVTKPYVIDILKHSQYITYEEALEKNKNR
jgi:hypothetical protein